MRTLILVAILLMTGSGPSVAATVAGTSSARLAAIGDDYWDWQMRTHPTWATYLGDHRFDDELEDLSPRARMARQGRMQKLRARIAELSLDALTPAERVSARVLDETLATDLEGLAVRAYEYDVNQLDGPQVGLFELASFHPTDTREGFYTLSRRLEAIPRYLAQYEANLRDGLAAHRTAPRVIVERVIGQLQRLGEKPADQSPFAAVVKKAPADLAARMNEALAGAVMPAFAHLRRFLADEYLPHARPLVGLSTMPGGAASYKYLIRRHTTTQLTADEIHQIGLAELAKIRAEADVIAKRNGYQDATAYFTAIRKDPKNYATTREGVLARYREVLARALAALPRAFARLPKAPVIVKPIEEFKERESPAAYYYSAPHDRSRPAAFYANTYDPASRPLYNATALTVHEAVPGHHLQIALAQEIPGLPMFRREGDFTAFTEGWALYCERLADELGLYENDLARAGMLTFQAWRACRLVVDTGMHAKGWTREQAIAFMNANLALSEKDIVAEVERYITWPGQALAYMIGMREIRRLRTEAQTTLGGKFDLKTFHDVVLRNGAVPLAVLAEEVGAWVKSAR